MTIKKSGHNYNSLLVALPAPAAFLFWQHQKVTLQWPQSERKRWELTKQWIAVYLRSVMFPVKFCLLMHLQRQTLLQIWRWFWRSVLWSCTAHTASACPSRSCTSTWRRRARPGAAWVPDLSTETASPPWPPPSGCSESAPCTTASQTAAWCASAPGGWSLWPNPLTREEDNTGMKQTKNRHPIQCKSNERKRIKKTSDH